MTPDAPSGLHPQLMLLMELQDLRAQHRELAAGAESTLSDHEQEHFHIDPAEARAQLEEKILELEERLSPTVKGRYDRILPQRERVVVPVINGVCYGCFVSIPTATVGDRDVHEELQSCENCGSFIYVLS